MHIIQWKKQAINDLVKIGRKIKLDSPANAEKIVAMIEAKVTPLATYPDMGRVGRKRGTRELVAHENYIVIYRALKNTIEILRVKHTAQQWP